MSRVPVLIVVVGGLLLLAGCFKADVEVPQNIPLGRSAPPAQVAQAPQNDQTGLARENQQLRERISYLQNQNLKHSRKYAELENDMNKVRDEINRLAAQRDRYKAAAGR